MANVIWAKCYRNNRELVRICGKAPRAPVKYNKSFMRSSKIMTVCTVLLTKHQDEESVERHHPEHMFLETRQATRLCVNLKPFLTLKQLTAVWHYLKLERHEGCLRETAVCGISAEHISHKTAIPPFLKKKKGLEKKSV